MIHSAGVAHAAGDRGGRKAELTKAANTPMARRHAEAVDAGLHLREGEYSVHFNAQGWLTLGVFLYGRCLLGRHGAMWF